MNKDTKFLLERMDTMQESLRGEMKQGFSVVHAKIDSLVAIKNKIRGANTVITTVVSAIVSAIIAFLHGK